ncbi:MAG TPA: DUF5781 family protein [Nitrososphaerales archaeon]|nr:DUF5781 family protein [Nitrososphaerales archaeon]
MSLSKGDRTLQEELDWALDRMNKAGYRVRSKVRLLVDPNLEIMGYANEEGGIQHIVVAEWALHSEMLGGLLFHELAHIYHTERRSPSHRYKVTNAVITEVSKREGLNERETGYLVEGFTHLQNVIVDDVVFAVMLESERRQALRFFSGWVTEAPSGYPLADSSALSRNAFALASVRRHDLALPEDPDAKEMAARSQMLADRLGAAARAKYDSIEEFLTTASASWDEETFGSKLAQYLDMLVALLREKDEMKDMR